MASSYNRLVLRHARLKQVTVDAQGLLEKCKHGGAPHEEFLTHRLKMKQCLEVFEKELFHYLNIDQNTDVGEMTQDQLKAEDTLTELETTWQFNMKQAESSSRSKLPELGLPSYSGDKLKWSEFWDRFVANIDKRDLAESEKLLYLLSCLKGTALETVSGLTATNANYTVAVETLKQRFGSNDVLIDAHYTALNNLQKADYSSVNCRNVLDSIERNLRVLEKLGEPIGGNHLRALILSKFPEKVLHEHHLTCGESNDLASIRNSLNRIITAMEKSSEFKPDINIANPTQTQGSSTTEALHVEARPRRHLKRKQAVLLSNVPHKRNKWPCIFCKLSNHNSADCKRFNTLEARKKQLVGRCHKCLKKGHRAEQCKRRIKCFGCGEAHVRLMCPNTKGEESISSNDHIPISCYISHNVTFLQTAVARVENPKTTKKHRCRLVLDSGSQRSYITNQTAVNLGLASTGIDKLLVFTFGAINPKEMSSPSTDIIVETKRDIRRHIRANIVPHITEALPIAKFNCSGTDFPADDDSCGESIDILIGNDYYTSFIRDGKIKIRDNLYVVDSDFGWLLSGNTDDEQYTVEQDNILTVATYCHCHNSSCPYFTEPDLPLRNIDVQFLWSLECIGIRDSPKATRQEEAVRHFNETVQYRDGRYQVKWPWIQFPPDLPKNFGLALGRLRSTLKRLDYETLKEYDIILKEQLELGIIEVVSPEPAEDSDHPVHYLAHHMVKQSGKKGRIVYDASAKTTGQKSLNECLYSGPSMLEDLTALLLKFRTKRYGILADVEKAFLQIALQEDDRDVTRFLWIKDVSKEATDDNLLYLRFCRVPFGIISSPFLLTATIRHHISQSNGSLLKSVADKCYVDNLVTGADSIQEAKQIYSQTRTTLEQLSMNIRDWISNNDTFMDTIPETHKPQHRNKVKVLGLNWNVQEDKLTLNLTKNHFSTDPPVNTKRKVLRALARVYDPCGFVCPLVLPMKLIFQNICESKVKWDTELPTETTSSIKEVMENLETIADIEVPRYIGSGTSKDNVKYQLHCFTDASKNAYAAVVYLKVVTQEQSAISFLMAKSHVSQTKDKDDLKIPKLELLCFLIGSRLLKYMRNNLELEIDKEYLWSDSLVVLSWMRSEKLLPPFVANRVNEIKQNHPNTEMCYVHTKSNPADIATRPELFEDKKTLWFNGPEFLVKDEASWPESRSYDAHLNLLSFGEVLGDSPDELTQRQEHSLTESHDGPLTLNHNSSDPKEGDLIELQDVDIPMEYSDFPTDELMELDDYDTQTEEASNQQETNLTKNMLEIKKLQRKYFPEEINGKKTHLARNLDLFVDADGILRCNGRMANTTWNYDMKYPILLPKSCEFTDKLIKDIHDSNYHVGAPQTLNIIRERYWIPHGRAQVVKVLRRCPQCIKHGGGPYRLPTTPALPPERVTYNKPFTYTGVDYFGHLFVETPSGKEKRWVALFTCLTVRAIHLEIVKDLSAEECFLALRRFAAARNCIPQKIYSDNATCFKLVSEVVKQPFCIKNNIEWKFIPQLAPWHGGYYERLIGLVKHCLKRTLEKHLLNDSRLSTVMREVEAVLNKRPLTRVGTEVEHVLRPVDFLSLGNCLMMKPSPVEAPADGTATKGDLIASWKRGSMILEEFKKMFIGQYLTSLRERYSHTPKQPRVRSHFPPKVGDLVQIKSDHKNRNQWRVGKIKSLIEGRDGECRVAKVQVDDSTFIRSIGHLYPLEVDDGLPEAEAISQDITEETEPVILNDENPQALSEQVDVEVDPPVDCAGTRHNEVPPVEQQPAEREDVRSKRVAAIRARDKILEWTRHLLTVLQ